MNKCYYPDWEGGFIVGKHKFKDGYCIFCGEKLIERDGDHVHLNIGNTKKLRKDFKTSGR